MLLGTSVEPNNIGMVLGLMMLPVMLTLSSITTLV